jgi:phosphoserine phosphatase
MSTDTKKIIVCDVCDTLYKSNTTFDFLRYLFRSGDKVKFFQLQLLSSKWSPIFYFFLVTGKFMKRDLVRQLSLKLLAGSSPDNLLQKAKQFCEQFLIGRINKPIFELLMREQKDNLVFFVSSSIYPVVKTIAEQYKFSFLSSMLSVKDGKITGTLSIDLTHQKHQEVKILMQQYSIDKLLVITDNRSDIKLVEMADEKYVVVGSEKEKGFWEHLNPHFIVS